VLGEVLHVERELVHSVLPQLLVDTSEDELRRAFTEHLEETRAHAVRVEHVFRMFDAEPSSVRSAPFEALRRQHDELAQAIVHPALRDLYHAWAAAHTEHYELAAYASLRTLAKLLGQGDAADLLDENRKQEERALRIVEKQAERLGKELARG
jgi:ferritin-like metal-binding protein YciE